MWHLVSEWQLDAQISFPCHHAQPLDRPCGQIGDCNPDTKCTADDFEIDGHQCFWRNVWITAEAFIRVTVFKTLMAYGQSRKGFRGSVLPKGARRKRAPRRPQKFTAAGKTTAMGVLDYNEPIGFCCKHKKL